MTIDTLERRLGLAWLDKFIDRELVPELEQVQAARTDQKGLPKGIQVSVFIVVGVFLIAYWLICKLIPETMIGNALEFILFPVLFIGIMGVGLYLRRDKIAELFLESQSRFLHRTEAMNRISAQLNLTYIPMPGGPSDATRAFANFRLTPPVFKEMVETMDDHGGFDDVAEIVRQSGLAMPSGLVIASDKNYETYYNQHVRAQQFEDGFRGERGGIAFSALEWIERNSEGAQTPHLLILMALPTRLSGLVEFKSKSESWPIRPREHRADKVKLISSEFHKAFHIRSQDQMEARLIFDPAVIERITDFAKGDPVRAAAFDNHLVFDIAGHNRFNMVDLITGEWSRRSIETTLTDFADMLTLVDGVANVFRVKKKLA